MWRNLLFLALAGSAGTLSRFGMSSLVCLVAGRHTAWATVVVNLSGCLLFGLIWPLAEDRLLLSHDLRLIVLTGFMGAYTTFSTFMFESTVQAESGRIPAALGNLAVQNVGGLALMYLGLVITRAMT